MASGPITSWQIDGETVERVSEFIWGAPKSLQMVIAAMKLKDTYSLEGKLWPTYIAYSKAETLSNMWIFIVASLQILSICNLSNFYHAAIHVSLDLYTPLNL